MPEHIVKIKAHEGKFTMEDIRRLFLERADVQVNIDQIKHYPQ